MDEVALDEVAIDHYKIFQTFPRTVHVVFNLKAYQVTTNYKCDL